MQPPHQASVPRSPRSVHRMLDAKRTELPLLRPAVSALLSHSKAYLTAGRRVFSLTFPVTQRDAVYRRIPALTDPAGYALVTSVEGRAKARFGVPSCITA
jgi:hypothetical protein